MPDDGKIMAVKACLNHEVDLFVDPLDSLNLAADFASTHNLSGRSENDRKERYCFNFTKFLKKIGPNGIKASALLLNGGKYNPKGRVTCGGSVAHKNPFFSLDVLKGAIIMYRHGMIGEIFPDFLNPEDFMTRPMCRSVTAHAENIGCQTQLSLFKKLCKFIKCKSNAGEH